MSFPVAPYDTMTWIATIVVVLVPIFIGWLVVFFTRERPKFQRTLWKLFAVLFAIVPNLIILCYAPLRYELRENYLLIKQVKKERRIPFDKIRKVERIKDLGSTIRTGGIGGVFGFTGNYSSSKIGPFKGYITNQSKLVLIETTEGKYVISPAEPEKFIRILRKFVNKNQN